MSPSGFGANLILNQESAGKTGTTDNNMSVWFMGYTPNLATAAMVAGANQLGHWITLNGQTIGGTFTDVAHGSTTAGPMWYGAMSQIQNWLPDATFTPPNGQDVNGVLTTVPDVAGVPYDQAAAQLHAGGLPGRRRWLPQLGLLATDTVAYTSPGAGSQTASGTVVTIYRSNGTPFVPPQHAPGNGNGGGNGNGNGNGGGQRRRATAGRARASSRRRPGGLAGSVRGQAASWRRTSAATAPPSARPRTCGVRTPITLPMARIPSSAAPVWAITDVTRSAISSSESCSGR